MFPRIYHCLPPGTLSFSWTRVIVWSIHVLQYVAPILSDHALYSALNFLHDFCSLSQGFAPFKALLVYCFLEGVHGRLHPPSSYTHVCIYHYQLVPLLMTSNTFSQCVYSYVLLFTSELNFFELGLASDSLYSIVLGMVPHTSINGSTDLDFSDSCLSVFCSLQLAFDIW